MEPIIYTLGKPDRIIDNSELHFSFEETPSPKLIKYGFNNINETLNLGLITSNSFYKTGLLFDFDRDDKDSFYAKASIHFKNKNFDLTFAEFWEIIALFSLFNTNQTIVTTHGDTIADIIAAYQKIYSNKAKLAVASGKSANKATLVIHKFSEIDIDENAVIQLIINDLPHLLDIQVKGASMILQLFGSQTQTTAEIIHYLSTLYDEAYLIKPTVTSDLSDSKYLVLIGLSDKARLTVPKHAKDLYLNSIGIVTPNDLVATIQCFNSIVIPKKYRKYNQIKSYLDTKVYEGITYQEMIRAQNENTDKWLETFTDMTKMKSLVDDAIKRSSTRCVTQPVSAIYA